MNRIGHFQSRTCISNTINAIFFHFIGLHVLLNVKSCVVFSFLCHNSISLVSLFVFSSYLNVICTHYVNTFSSKLLVYSLRVENWSKCKKQSSFLIYSRLRSEVVFYLKVTKNSLKHCW